MRISATLFFTLWLILYGKLLAWQIIIGGKNCLAGVSEYYEVDTALRTSLGLRILVPLKIPRFKKQIFGSRREHVFVFKVISVRNKFFNACFGLIYIGSTSILTRTVE